MFLEITFLDYYSNIRGSTPAEREEVGLNINFINFNYYFVLRSFYSWGKKRGVLRLSIYERLKDRFFQSENRSNCLR